MGIIKDRIVFDLVGESYLNFKECKNKDFIYLGNMVKKIPFREFNLEFVKEDKDYIFTDFYVNKL